MALSSAHAQKKGPCGNFRSNVPAHPELRSPGQGQATAPNLEKAKL